jgi:hypothetical protein
VRKIFSACLNPLVIFGSLLVGVGLMAALLGGLWWTRPQRRAPAQPTAVVEVIARPTLLPTLPPTSQPELIEASPTVPPATGEFAVGAYVQISGTAGAGLRLRDEPGLQASVRLLGLEAEVFQIQDGPRQADDYAWWYLVAPSDASRHGWAVANYLSIVQNP